MKPAKPPEIEMPPNSKASRDATTKPNLARRLFGGRGLPSLPDLLGRKPELVPIPVRNDE